MKLGQFDPSDRRPMPVRRVGAVRVLARWLAARGVTPNQVSIFGMAAGVGSGLVLFLTQYGWHGAWALWIGSAVLGIFRGLANNVDGLIAIESGKATPGGVLYNEVPDRVSDVALMIGAGYAVGGSEVLGYLAACVALFVASVRVTARLAGAPSDFGGPMAKEQRTFLVAAVAVYMAITPPTWQLAWGPDDRWGVMAAALLVAVVGGAWTAVRRLHRAARALRDQAR